MKDFLFEIVPSVQNKRNDLIASIKGGMYTIDQIRYHRLEDFVEKIKRKVKKGYSAVLLITIFFLTEVGNRNDCFG